MDKGIGSLRPRNNLWLEKAGDIHLVICCNNEIYTWHIIGRAPAYFTYNELA
jgi:hypothetical protein